MNIAFHVLELSSGLPSLRYICGLIEKIDKQQPVYIFVNSQDEAERLDTLLWTYRDDSFIPHQLLRTDDDMPPPIQIGHREPPASLRGTLINLRQEIPAFFKQFDPMIEIVFSDPVMQQLARERYRQYRDQGCDIQTYKIKASQHDLP